MVNMTHKPASARDDYPDPCSTTDQEAMFEEIDRLRAILGPLVYPEGVRSPAPSSDGLPEDFAYELGWVALGETMGDDDGCEAARAMGESIVVTAEMLAIKAVLRHHAKEYALAKQACGTSASKREILSAWGLPDIVTDWVLS